MLRTANRSSIASKTPRSDIPQCCFCVDLFFFYYGLHEELPPALSDVQPISFKIDKQKIDQKYQQQLEEKARRKQLV